MMSDAIRAVILGIIEGVTEFLPVSSTGHLLLAERFFDLGEGDFWKSFAILIQLGAILAIVVLYFAKLWRIAIGMFTDADARRFVIGVLVAFLPAVIVGLVAGKYIKSLSVQSLGRVLLADRRRRHPALGRPARSRAARARRHALSAADVSLDRHRAVPCDDPRRVALRRSASSPRCCSGADKRAAAEFSFFLAIPTMVGAFAYDFYKNRADMTIGSSRHHRDRLRGVVHHRDHRGEDVPRDTSPATASCCSPGGASSSARSA